MYTTSLLSGLSILRNETMSINTIARRCMATTSLLSGIKVLDLTRILAGPWCTMLLGDYGADVIKIEPLTRGDDTRSWGPPFVKTPLGLQSAYYISCNRNKMSVCLDLKSSAGLKIMHGLVRECDIFIENFVPGKLDGLGLSYAALSAINPRLVYASLSGYGDTGPSSTEAGYDVAVAARGGLMSITGEEGSNTPVKVGVAVTDISTGLYLNSAILAALVARGRTGRGQWLGTSLLETQIAMLANVGSNVLNSDSHREPKRMGTAHSSIVPYQAFEALGGSSFILAVMSDAQFATLANALHKSEWSRDERFKTNAARVKNRVLLLSSLDALFKGQRAEYWIAKFKDLGITVAPINSVQQALEDPQVLHRNMILDVPYGTNAAAEGAEKLPPHQPGRTFADGADFSPERKVRVLGFPVKFSDAAPSVRLAPPALGQHTRHVLKSILGMSHEQIVELERAKVISSWDPQEEEDEGQK